MVGNFQDWAHMPAECVGPHKHACVSREYLKSNLVKK